MLKIQNDCFQVDHDTDKNNDLIIYGLGDVHFDAKGCDRDLLADHLAQATKEKAGVVQVGDFFDVMNSRDDRRGGKGQLKQEVVRDDYFMAVVEEAADWLAPKVKDLPWMIIHEGNHETKVKKYGEIDLIKLLCIMLKAKGVSNVFPAGYCSYLNISHQRGKGKSTKFMDRTLIKTHHGSQGGRRSKGTLMADLRGQMYPDADIIFTGHIHGQWSLPLVAERVDQRGNILEHETLHLQLPSYKSDIHGKDGGFAIEREFQRATLGGYKVTINCKRKDISPWYMKKIREVRL